MLLKCVNKGSIKGDEVGEVDTVETYQCLKDFVVD